MKHYEVAAERLVDGTIEFGQDGGCGETSYIVMHPSQLQFITHELCGRDSPAGGDPTTEAERKLGVLVDKLQAIVCESWIREEIIECCGEGHLILAKLDGLLDLALEFDGGRLEPEYRDEPSTPPKPKGDGKPPAQQEPAVKPSAETVGQLPLVS